MSKIEFDGKMYFCTNCGKTFPKLMYGKYCPCCKTEYKK